MSYGRLDRDRVLTIRAVRVLGEGHHGPGSDEFLDTGFLRLSKDMKGSFNRALQFRSDGHP